MADDNSTTPIGTTPINLDPETQRAIIYALEAQVTALSRLEGFFRHLEAMDLDFNETDDMLFEGAQDSLKVVQMARAVVCSKLFGDPDTDIHRLHESVPTLHIHAQYRAFKYLSALLGEPTSADICRHVEFHQDPAIGQEGAA